MDPTAHQHVELNGGADLQGFRETLRIMTLCNIPPEQITWSTKAEPDLFGNQDQSAYGAAGRPIILPRYVAEMIKLVVCHHDPEKYARLYELVWRLQHENKRLLEVDSDERVHRLEMMKQEVLRDIHKIQASLRFQQVNDPTVGDRFIAWFEPEHFIIEHTAQFFIDRFGSIDWTILTPKGSLRWNKKELLIGPPALRGDRPAPDAFEIGWRIHYESTFNPARTNVQVKRQLTPKPYWRDRPDMQPIPDMVQTSALRVEDMIDREAEMPAKRNPAKRTLDKAVAAIPDQAPKTLAELNRMIQASEPFVEGSDKAVLGEGPMHPAIAFVGEQPGDQEDLQGRPFVGPAGKLLDRAMEEAGIERKKTYITNAVKHFKFVQRGKRRLHQSPTAGEVKHYRWWLEKELDLVQPELVVGLGATAVHALAGKATPIGKNRGPAEFGERRGYITIHPSFLLRLQDSESKQREYTAFVKDLKRIRDMAK
jgi:probable DNA metabolism protein